MPDLPGSYAEFQAMPLAKMWAEPDVQAFVGDLRKTGWLEWPIRVLLVIGGLFVLETLSVIIQVASFKTTGKRVFRMAPLHHHYEKKGWKESTVVIRFWIIAIVLALIGLSTLKLR